MIIQKCFSAFWFGKSNFITDLQYVLPKFNFKHEKLWLLSKNTNYTNFISERKLCTTCDSDLGGKGAYYRHCYDSKIESAVNQQINAELYAWYAYLNIASYFGRSSVALPGCNGYFMKMCYEEHEHAVGFMNYQNLRGGKVQLYPFDPIQNTEWCNIPDALFCALDLEKSVKEKLVKLYRLAEKCGDSNVMDMLDPVIYEQERAICELARLVTRANFLTKTGVGKYLFDRELHETHVKLDPVKCIPEEGSKLYK